MKNKPRCPRCNSVINWGIDTWMYKDKELWFCQECATDEECMFLREIAWLEQLKNYEA